MMSVDFALEENFVGYLTVTPEDFESRRPRCEIPHFYSLALGVRSRWQLFFKGLKSGAGAKAFFGRKNENGKDRGTGSYIHFRKI